MLLVAREACLSAVGAVWVWECGLFPAGKGARLRAAHWREYDLWSKRKCQNMQHTLKYMYIPHTHKLTYWILESNWQFIAPFFLCLSHFVFFSLSQSTVPITFACSFGGTGKVQVGPNFSLILHTHFFLHTHICLLQFYFCFISFFSCIPPLCVHALVLC